MKKFLVLVFSLAAFSAIADESDLMKAFQREYSFLSAQKASLMRDQQTSQKVYQDRIRKLEAQVSALESEIVKAGAQNDLRFEELQELERKKKEQKNRDGSLQALFKRAQKTLNENFQGLNFQMAEKTEPVVPDLVQVADFSEVKDQALELLQQSASVSEIRGAYKNRQGDLMEGPILRFGRIAAHALEGSQNKVLGPDGEGLLVELDTMEAGRGPWAFYLFENLMDKAVVKKKASVFDRFADALPIVVMGLMFALVGALFLMFARE